MGCFSPRDRPPRPRSWWSTTTTIAVTTTEDPDLDNRKFCHTVAYADDCVRSATRAAPPRRVAVMSRSQALCRLTVGERRNEMIKWALRRAIDKFEREWKYDGSYMRDIIDASPRAAWLFSRAVALGRFRRGLPIGPGYAPGITAVRHEDGGPCTQLGVAMAEREGVSPAVLRAVLTGN